MAWVFDSESDGFVEEATVVHCAVFKNRATKEKRIFTPKNVDQIPKFLEGVDKLIGHNIIKHDLPLFKKIFGYTFKGRVYDTLVMSRILKPKRILPLACPNRTAGPHSIEAWGYRVGRGKPEHNDWSTYTEDMLHRCDEDTEINDLVVDELEKEMKDGDWSEAVPMTMKLFQVFKEIEDYGWKVDREWMDKCLVRLEGMIERIDCFLKDKLPYVYDVVEQKVKGEYNYVKKPFKKNGEYTENMLSWLDKSSTSFEDCLNRIETKEIAGPFTRISYRRLSLNKRNEVVKMLLDAGWIPDQWNYNDDNERTSPKLSKDDPFDGIDGAFGRHIARRVQARHRHSNIVGFIKRIRPDGRMASEISGLATTGRVKHKGLVNIPNSDSFFGSQIRKIFIAEDDKILVGVDSAGNQVRQLCAKMGDKAYEYEVLHGDVHSTNQKTAGLATRSNAKTFFYGFLFGSGDEKTGRIIGGTAADGKRLKAKFLEGLPKLKSLLGHLTTEWRENAKRRKNKWGGYEYYNGWVSGLDGRPVYIKSEHAILVYVLQNMEAIQMSYALLFTRKWLDERGLTFGKEYGIVCFYHDEINVECYPEYKELIGKTIKKAIIFAGKYLGISTPHDGSIKYGKNWEEIH